MPLWGVILIALAIIAVLIITVVVLNKSANRPEVPVTADGCANKALTIFNIFIALNIIGAIIGSITCGCNQIWSGMIGCLIDLVFGTLAILLLKYCWQSLFLIVKEK